jgi:hypothetical protein
MSVEIEWIAGREGGFFMIFFLDIFHCLFIVIMSLFFDL